MGIFAKRDQQRLDAFNLKDRASSTPQMRELLPPSLPSHPRKRLRSGSQAYAYQSDQRHACDPCASRVHIGLILSGTSRVARLLQCGGEEVSLRSIGLSLGLGADTAPRIM